MAYLYVRHTVIDFNNWYRIFDSNKEEQEKHGLADFDLFRDQKDPNDVIIIFRVTDVEKAREYIYAPEAEIARDEAGVIGEPESFFLDKVEN